jgi:hypothetical protein
MTRCYVCNVNLDSADPCGAIDGEVAECPREPVRSGPMPDDLTPNQVFGVGGRCRRNSGGHRFELEWHGSTCDLRCRWCGKREQP